LAKGLDIPKEGRLVYTIAYKMDADGCLSFRIEGWKNFIQTEQDQQVGQVVLI
jgi:hypothetical protein